MITQRVKRIRRAALFLLPVLLFNSNAFAQPSTAMIVLSYGNTSCGEFVQATKNEKQNYLYWVLGYISGANIADKGLGRMAGKTFNEDAATVWLTNYCSENALDPFVQAAAKLRIALGGNVVR